MNAAYYGRTEIVKLLISAGADIDLLDIDDWTALSYTDYKDHTQIVDLLLSAGADENSLVYDEKPARG